MLATLDVAVFPARWEAQGIALIEAMAASRAVIATRLPAHAEAVADGESGLLVEPGDVDAMSRALIGLLSRRSPNRSRCRWCSTRTRTSSART
jgi:glycosyltransferase involved in cell wall biosynthesis